VGRHGINLTPSFPLENLLTLVFEFALKYRDTMAPAVRDRWDLMLIEDYEEFRARMKRIGKWLGDAVEEIDERIGGPDAK
jgi:hypothetical protein